MEISKRTHGVSNYCFHTINSDCTAPSLLPTGYPNLFYVLKRLIISVLSYAIQYFYVSSFHRVAILQYTMFVFCAESNIVDLCFHMIQNIKIRVTHAIQLF